MHGTSNMNISCIKIYICIEIDDDDDDDDDDGFYAPEIEDRGAYCFCPVILSFHHSVMPSFCHSVILSETLTLLITFEQ